MITVADLEKRLENLKGRLEKAREEHENNPCPEKVRKIRKRVKRHQRKLRGLRAAQEKASKTAPKPKAVEEPAAAEKEKAEPETVSAPEAAEEKAPEEGSE